jgi:16S rRNA (adenine1518-N6/adenine1519-N6)-dimethyltransferase
VERLFDIGPGAFSPPPRVWSALVRLRARSEPLFAVSAHFAPLVAAAFSQRRKTLRNALGAWLTRAQISACGIDPGARPETLTPAAFNALAQTLDRTRA